MCKYDVTVIKINVYYIKFYYNIEYDIEYINKVFICKDVYYLIQIFTIQFSARQVHILFDEKLNCIKHKNKRWNIPIPTIFKFEIFKSIRNKFIHRTY